MMKIVSVEDIVSQISEKVSKKNLMIAAGCAAAAAVAGAVTAVAAMVHSRREREIPVLIFPVGISVDDCDFVPGHEDEDAKSESK